METLAVSLAAMGLLPKNSGQNVAIPAGFESPERSGAEIGAFFAVFPTLERELL
jgi:hypothetical protein